MPISKFPIRTAVVALCGSAFLFLFSTTKIQAGDPTPCEITGTVQEDLRSISRAFRRYFFETNVDPATEPPLLANVVAEGYLTGLPVHPVDGFSYAIPQFWGDYARVTPESSNRLWVDPDDPDNYIPGRTEDDCGPGSEPLDHAELTRIIRRDLIRLHIASLEYAELLELDTSPGSGDVPPDVATLIDFLYFEELDPPIALQGTSYVSAATWDTYPIWDGASVLGYSGAYYHPLDARYEPGAVFGLAGDTRNLIAEPVFDNCDRVKQIQAKLIALQQLLELYAEEFSIDTSNPASEVPSYNDLIAAGYLQAPPAAEEFRFDYEYFLPDSWDEYPFAALSQFDPISGILAGVVFHPDSPNFDPAVLTEFCAPNGSALLMR